MAVSLRSRSIYKESNVDLSFYELLYTSIVLVHNNYITPDVKLSD